MTKLNLLTPKVRACTCYPECPRVWVRVGTTWFKAPRGTRLRGDA